MYLNKTGRNILSERPFLITMVVLFLLSLLFLMFKNLRTEQVIFYFPDAIDEILISEYRTLPREFNLSARILQYVYEYILGPSQIRSYNIFARSTEITSLFLPTRQEVIINLATNALERVNDKGVSFEQSLDILGQGLRTNFLILKNVRFLVDGQELFVPPYTPH